MVIVFDKVSKFKNNELLSTILDVHYSYIYIQSHFCELSILFCLVIWKPNEESLLHSFSEKMLQIEMFLPEIHALITTSLR